MTSTKRGSPVVRTKAPRSFQQLWKAADRPDYQGMLLLDTHVWIWMIEGDATRMSPSAVRLIQHANGDGRLLVCDISFWEVAMKAAKGQIELAPDPVAWLERAGRAPGIGYIPLDRTTLIQSTRLRGTLHGDPADRMLIAASQVHATPLATADRRIIEYAASRPGVPVCDVRG